jgi:type I restriction enzyme S subunit
MTVKDLRTLVDNLDEYIHVPDGIDRLKKTILHLAVSGQLVPQDPSEGTGQELYDKIQIEKAKLIAGGKLKKQQPLPAIREDEIPFEIPKSWKWTRLGDLSSNISYGYTESASKENIGPKFVRITDIQNGAINWQTVPYCKIADKEKSKYLLEDGDILFARTGGTIGKSYLCNNPPESVYASYLIRVQAQRYIEPEFLLIYFDTPHYWSTIYEDMSGTGQPNFNGTKLSHLCIPTPSLRSQTMIIKKVKTIFSLIDELEIKYRVEQEERRKLVVSSLAKLSKGESLIALNELTEIIKTKEDTGELRKTILHLAVSGKLVPQDPSEGTGQQLYDQIQAEKQKLIVEGKLKKQKPFPVVRGDETPFEIPENWKWARLNNVYDVRDGTHDTPKYVDEGFPLVTSKNLSSGKLDMSNVKFISERDHLNIKLRSEVNSKDILFAMIGSIGNPVIVDTEREFSVKNVALFKPYNADYYCPEWLLMSLIIAQYDMKEKSTGGVQFFVSLGFVRSYPSPLPPRKEQARIVQKTTQLLNLTTELDKQSEK